MTSFPLRSLFPGRAAAALLSLLVVACGGGVPPTLYVLGPDPSTLGAEEGIADGTPVVEIKPIRLPDYLDTTDLLARSGDRVVASEDGRWAERLSTGMARALVMNLSARLPGLVVTSRAPVKEPARQLLLDVTSYEATAADSVVLAVRWTVTDGSGSRVLSADRARITAPLTGKGDAAVVQAMNTALDLLVDRLVGPLSVR